MPRAARRYRVDRRNSAPRRRGTWMREHGSRALGRGVRDVSRTQTLDSLRLGVGLLGPDLRLGPAGPGRHGDRPRRTDGAVPAVRRRDGLRRRPRGGRALRRMGRRGANLPGDLDMGGQFLDAASPGTEAAPEGVFMGMAYDAAHADTVLFGGIGPHGLLDDTWTWDGTDWTKASPVHSPPARSGFAMTYDATHGRIVLFGGFGHSVLGDTWTWDGTDWTKASPMHSPPARSESAMTYDAARGRVVLFGGGGISYLGDTWTWDGTDWTKASPVHAPAPRRDAEMAYAVSSRPGRPLRGRDRRPLLARHVDVGRRRLDQAGADPFAVGPDRHGHGG